MAAGGQVIKVCTPAVLPKEMPDLPDLFCVAACDGGLQTTNRAHGSQHRPAWHARTGGERRDETMTGKAVPVGINHVALEVGNIQEALEFYGSFLEFEVARQSETAAFVYFGDQFINFSVGRRQGPDDHRHFGIAVDDKERAIRCLVEMGVEFLEGPFTDFLDPWGNRVELTTYTKIQFTKADHVLKGMGLDHLEKTPEALKELAAKGMAPGA